MINMVNVNQGGDNKFGDIHAFYVNRSQDVEIMNNYVKNNSGPPFKPTRDSTTDVRVHDNDFYYVGPYASFSAQEEQKGFVRFSSKETGCPSGIFIEDNDFWYPYCDRADCLGEQALRCTSQGACSSVCDSDFQPNAGGTYDNEGSNYGDPLSIVDWTNNNFRAGWQSSP